MRSAAPGLLIVPHACPASAAIAGAPDIITATKIAEWIADTRIRMSAAPAPVKPAPALRHHRGEFMLFSQTLRESNCWQTLPGFTTFTNILLTGIHTGGFVSIAGLLPLVFVSVRIEDLALVTQLLAVRRDRGGNVGPVDRQRRNGPRLRLTRRGRRRCGLGGGVNSLTRRDRTRRKWRRRYRIRSGRRGRDGRRDLGRRDRNDQWTGWRNRGRPSRAFDSRAA